jgi:hypothetical protein
MPGRYLTIDDVELSNARCGTCIYFITRKHDSSQRFCGRYPHTHPAYVRGESELNHTRPPKVMETMRCGEWKGKAIKMVAARMKDK